MNDRPPDADEARAARSDWPTDDGEMASRVREMDWAKTPFGPVAGWPVGLKTVVDLMMASRFPMFVAWGPELAFIYNDPYAEILGDKHPRSLGSPFFDIWHEIWDDITPFINSALSGKATWIEDLPLTMNRHGQDEATWFTFSYSPMRDDAGEIAGLFCACEETSRQVLASRALQEGEERQAFMLRLSDAMRPIADLREVADTACRLLVEHLGGSRAQYADLSGAPGEETGRIRGEYVGTGAAMPRQFPLAPFGEPVLDVLRSNRTLVISDVDTDPRLGEEQREAFHAVSAPAVISVPLVKGGSWTAALTMHDLNPRDWSARDIELTEEVADRTWAAVERARAEAAMRESEERYRLIVENARYAAIFSTDPDGIVTDWHEGAASAFGYARDEIIGRDSRILWTPEDQAALEPDCEFGTAAETGKAPNVRWHQRKDGGRVFIDGVVTALHDAAGRLTGFLKVGLDATERRRADEHQKMLHAELQHRVRNTLAIVRSIVRRTAATSRSVDEFERHLDGRLGAFARTQAYVTRDPDAGVDLELLIRDEMLAHASNGREGISIKGPEIRLGAKHAETLGLAVHELASNAVRHGALASNGNRIDVSWSVEGKDAGRQLHFIWREHLANGGLSPPERTGFGTELLQRVIGYELDADPSIEFKADGLAYEVTMPLPRKLRRH